jgi:hypothetical protein
MDGLSLAAATTQQQLSFRPGFLLANAGFILPIIVLKKLSARHEPKSLDLFR